MVTSSVSHVFTSIRRYAKFLFYRTWGGPDAQQQSNEYELRLYRYQRLWDYYQGTAFDDLEAWSRYRQAFGLYRQIRLVWDHFHALVEFYATHVWSGTLSLNGQPLPDGVANAIPLADDTADAIRVAIGQLWSWWNFQDVMTTLVRYTAALGEFLVELDDDTERGKVGITFVWPGHVTFLELDDAGNVKRYVIEYDAVDPDTNETYRYRRDVDQERFQTSRNRSLIGISDFQEMETIPNPYGFVPAVWFRHIRIMGVHGEPAIWATQSELDEVNGLFSHIIDKSHVSLNAPIIVSGNIAPNVFRRALDDMSGAIRKTFTEDLDEPRGSREELNILEGPSGTTVSTIQLNVTDAAQILDRVIAGIERKTPEVTFYEQLRGMTQITGPAAARLLGDVEHKIRAIAGNYDRSLIKLLQMGLSVGGFRSHESLGGWATKSEQQTKFATFDLASYARGDLDFDIMPRDLVPMTAQEKYQLLAMKKAVLPHLPETQLAKEGGYHDDDIKQWLIPSPQELQQQRQQLLIAPAPTPTRPVGAPPGGPGRAPQPPSPTNGRTA
jgi:hypothetical protein